MATSEWTATPSASTAARPERSVNSTSSSAANGTAPTAVRGARASARVRTWRAAARGVLTLASELRRGDGGAAGGKQIVDDDDAGALGQRALLDLLHVLRRHLMRRDPSVVAHGPPRTDPYSLLELTAWHGPGSLPALRTGTNAHFRPTATMGPNRKPRASRPGSRWSQASTASDPATQLTNDGVNTTIGVADHACLRGAGE